MISIVMPAYNASESISMTIESILTQSYQEFKLYIINDGSTDDTKDIIQSYNDDRIVYLENKNNSGIVTALNKGLENSNSKYVVRMDSDDIMMENRLQYQFDFMEKNPEIDIMATSAVFKYPDGKKLKGGRRPKNTKEIRTFLLFDSPIIHPSVILRRESLNDDLYYDESFVKVEDYELWTRLVLSHNFFNSSKKLITYTINPNSISRKLNKKQSEKDKLMIKVYRKYFKMNNIIIDDEELTIFRSFVSGNIDLFNQDLLNKINNLLYHIRQSMNNEEFNIKYFDYLIAAFFRRNKTLENTSKRRKINLYNDYFKFDTTSKTVLLLNNILLRRK